MKNNKILAILFTIALLTAMTSCGGSSNNNSSIANEVPAIMNSSSNYWGCTWSLGEGYEWDIELYLDSDNTGKLKDEEYPIKGWAESPITWAPLGSVDSMTISGDSTGLDLTMISHITPNYSTDATSFAAIFTTSAGSIPATCSLVSGPF
jgi:hypothetical protein